MNIEISSNEMTKLIFATYPALYRQLIPFHLKHMLENGIHYETIWDYYSFPDNETMEEFFLDNPEKSKIDDTIVGDEILVHTGKKIVKVDKNDRFIGYIDP